MAQRVGEVGLGLPQEGGHVVEIRSFASALEVDEVRLTVDQHHVARLEVAVHERAAHGAHQHLSHRLEIVLETVFLEFQPGSLEKTIFEIVQIPEDAAVVELRQGIALAEIESYGAAELDVRKHANGTRQQLLLLGGERASLATLLYHVEEDSIAEVGLEICHAVVGDCHDLGHREIAAAEMLGQRNERLILLQARAEHSHEALYAVQTVVAAVGPRGREILHLRRLRAGIPAVKFR